MAIRGRRDVLSRSTITREVQEVIHAETRRFAKNAFAIQRRFDGRPQDIEWVVTGGQIMIVQSRDYARGSEGLKFDLNL